jgi:hypothetical protein
VSSLAGIDQDKICISVNDIGFGFNDKNPLRLVKFFRK